MIRATRLPTMQLLLFLVLHAPSGAFADIMGDESLVDEVVVAYETNLAKLRTWVADIEVHNGASGGDPGPGLFRSDSSTDIVTMAYDRDLPGYMVRWRCVASTGIDEQGSVRPGWNDGRECGEMVIDGQVHKITVYFPTRDKGNQGPSILTGTAERTKPAGPFEERIVPIELFWHRDRPLSDRLRLMVSNAKRFEGRTLELKREGSLALVSAVTPQSSEQLVIDLAKGGMLVSSSTKDKSSSRDEHIELESVSGVWVPKLIKRSRVNAAAAGDAKSREYHRELLWKSNLVNVEIPRSHFTVDSFREGRPARVLDWRTKAITKLEGQNGKSAQKQAQSSVRTWKSYVAYFLTIVAIVAIIALFIWRRMKP